MKMNYSEWFVGLLVIHIVSANQTILASPKIVGGSAIRIRDVPFLLALHVKQDGFICGAVIISAWWGMTALHCLKPGVTSARNYYVRAGSSMSGIGGSVHRLSKFYLFDSQYFDGKSIPPHDITLFRVRARFRFSTSVKPAKLPLDGIVPPKLLRVSGWGRTHTTSIETFPSSVYLQSANVTSVSWKDCISATSWYEWVVNDKNHLCYGGENADACYGDSGGPLADKRTVYGLVSFGEGCGVAPGVYTKVSFYRRWIKRVTKI